MNGFEFRREQLKDPALARIPVITYSGIADIRPRQSGSVAPIGARQLKDVDGILALVRQHCAKAAPETRH
jgi:hypothetical protein